MKRILHIPVVLTFAFLLAFPSFSHASFSTTYTSFQQNLASFVDSLISYFVPSSPAVVATAVAPVSVATPQEVEVAKEAVNNVVQRTVYTTTSSPTYVTNNYYTTNTTSISGGSTSGLARSVSRANRESSADITAIQTQISLLSTSFTTAYLSATGIPTTPHSFLSWSIGNTDAHSDTAPLYINPSSAAADTNLLGIAVNGSTRFLIDAEGDIFGNSLTLVGSTALSSTTISTLNVENAAIIGDSVNDQLIITARLNSDLIPYTDNAFDLGTTTSRYKSIYATTFYGSGAGLTNVFSTSTTRGVLSAGNGLSYDSATGIFTNASSSPWLLNGTSAYYNLGNVGIGTTTPGSALTVAGTSHYTGLGVFAGGISSPGTGSNSEAFGNNATTGTAQNSLAIGQGANASGNGHSIAIGSQASASGQYAISLGRNNSTVYAGSILIGNALTGTNFNQLVVGGGNTGTFLSDGYFGNGVTHATPQAFTFQTTGASGTDIAGANLTLAGGKGTGNAAGGALIFSTSDAGSSGATLQSLTEKMRISANGNVGIGTASPTTKLDVAGNINMGSGGSVVLSMGQIGYAAPGDNSTGQKITLFGVQGTIDYRDYAIGVGSTEGVWFNGNGGAYTWYNSSSPIMAIRSGNLGIGTTTPSAKLAITGTSGSTGNIFSIASSTEVTLAGFAISSAGSPSYDFGKLRLGYGEDSNFAEIYRSEDTSNTGDQALYIVPGGSNERLIFGTASKTLYSLNFSNVSNFEGTPAFGTPDSMRWGATTGGQWFTQYWPCRRKCYL